MSLNTSSSVFENREKVGSGKNRENWQKQSEIRAAKGWEIKTKSANGRQKSGAAVDLPASPRK
jgi:hypothetical protein